MAASAKKKNKKGKTLTLTDFLAEDKGSSNAPPSYPAKSTSWADETDDLDGDVSTSWHTEEDSYRAPAIDRSILPTAPRSAREPNVDRSRLPRSPPYTAFLGNLPYDVTEDSIKDFFRGLAISAVRLPREPSNPERLKGFGYAEFDDVDSLLRALSLNEENLGNRRIRVDIADQSNDKERDNGSMGGRDRGGRMSDMGPDKTDTDWRARPSSDADDGPPKREEAFGERSRDRFESDRFRDGPRRDNDRYDGGRDRFRDRYDDRDRRDYDRGGFDSRGGSSAGGGRRAFGTGYRRDDDSRGSSDRYGERERYGDREERYEKKDDNREATSVQRPRLNLKPRSLPKEEEGSGGTLPAAPPSSGSRTSSIFGAAKPVDTAAKEREVEERLKKEEERLQRQLDEDKGRGPDRKMRDRDPSWRTEESHPQRSRTGSESSQPGSTSGRGSRCRDSERSGENEVFSGREGEPSSPGTSPQPPITICSKEPLKVMPAPPPKENVWAKRSAASTGSSEGDGRPPVSPVSPSGSTPPKLSSPNSADERESGKDENKANAMRRDRGPPQARGGPAGRGRGEGPNRDRRKEADRKDNRRDRDSRPPPEPKKFEETPTPKFSSASKYAALLMDGDQGDDAEDVE
uniref:Eukaryotic translation initiation factor 4B n=1 Tax=Gasterosteus aculeatus aculeatus TaxID=481459 RepID=G3NZ46_GASAC